MWEENFLWWTLQLLVSHRRIVVVAIVRKSRDEPRKFWLELWTASKIDIFESRMIGTEDRIRPYVSRTSCTCSDSAKFRLPGILTRRHTQAKFAQTCCALCTDSRLRCMGQEAGRCFSSSRTLQCAFWVSFIETRKSNKPF